MKKLKVECEHAKLVDPNELIDHPKNPNTHPEKQVKMLAKSIKAYGWRHPIVVSNRSGYIVAGHGRKQAALVLKCVVPVDYQNFDSDEEELAVLLADNVLPELAKMDKRLLFLNKELLKEHSIDLETIGIEIEELEIPSAESEEGPPEEGQSEELNQIYDLKDSPIFSSSNKYGIPDLLPNKLWRLAPTSVWNGKSEVEENSLFLYGSNKFPDDCKRGVLGFYVDDYRFESIWYDTAKIIGLYKDKNFSAVLEPDFSMWRDDPLVVQMWNKYRSRWIARYWQEFGVPIIPSLNWSDERTFEFVLDGVPIGCDLVSVQCRSLRDNTGRQLFLKGLNRSLLTIRPKQVFIYGGETHQKWIEPFLEFETRIIWASDFMTQHGR